MVATIACMKTCNILHLLYLNVYAFFNEFLNDIVKPGFTVYFEQQGSSNRAVKFLITSFGANNPGSVIWNVELVSETGFILANNNDVATQFESEKKPLFLDDIGDVNASTPLERR